MEVCFRVSVFCTFKRVCGRKALFISDVTSCLSSLFQLKQLQVGWDIMLLRSFIVSSLSHFVCSFKKVKAAHSQHLLYFYSNSQTQHLILWLFDKQEPQSWRHHCDGEAYPHVQYSDYATVTSNIKYISKSPIFKNWPPVEFILQTNRGTAYYQNNLKLLLNAPGVSYLAWLTIQLVVILADWLDCKLSQNRIGISTTRGLTLERQIG